MPPGSFPVEDEGRKIGKICLEDLQKRMQQTEGNASSIERQLNDVRNHLKTLREHVSLDGSNVQNLDLESISLQTGLAMKLEKQQEIASNSRDSPALRLVVEGVESEIARVKHKVDQVQMELQISWMSFTTLQLQLKAKHQAELQHQEQSRVDHLQGQLDKKCRQLEQLSGSYERLRQCFMGKESEFKQERQLVSGSLNALGDHLKPGASNQEVSKIAGLSVEAKDWCAATEIKADEHASELKLVRSELASIATSFLQIFEPSKVSFEEKATSRQVTPPPRLPPSPPVVSKQEVTPDKMFARMSTRIDELVQELNSDFNSKPQSDFNSKPEPRDKVSRNLWSCTQRWHHPLAPEGDQQPEPTPAGSPDAGSMNLWSGKRKLNEVSGASKPDEEARVQPDVDEKNVQSQKKNFMSGLRESFHRVRQREMLCAAMEQRLVKVRLLLEQAQRSWVCASSDLVAMKSKQQIEQAYQELTHVQADIETIRNLSSDQQQELLDAMGHQPPTAETSFEPPSSAGSFNSLVVESGDMQRLKSEFLKQVEVNAKLKQQVARTSMQAEKAEGVMAAERMEVEKLRQQVQVITEKLKQEARSLNESHFEALRVRDLTIQRLREQIRSDEESKRDEVSAALERIEELSLENERLQARVGGQDLDLRKLRKENVCLVVEKLAFEGSARSLQEKMAKLMYKLTQTKQHWNRFVVYCET